MTGAGSAQAVFVKENSFMSEPTSPTYYRPGRNIRIEELTLDNLLTRLREPSTPEPVDSIVGNLDGAFAASWIVSSDTHDDVRDIVFNSAGTGFTTGLASTSSWYVGSTYLDTADTEQTIERNLKGVIPFQYQLDWSQGQPMRATFTGGYADEDRVTSFTPGSVTGPANGNDANFHNATLTVDNTGVSRLESFSLRFEGPLYRYLRDETRTPDTAILAAPETSLRMTATYHTDDYLEIAYGGATGTASPQSTLSSVSNSDLAIDIGGTVFVRYTMSELKPRRYSWNDLVNADADLTDPIDYDVNGGISIATS